MKAGDSINIKAVVLRVEGSCLHAQTATGQLIQTDVANTAEHKAILNAPENKAVLTAPENKSSRSKKP